MLPYRYAVRALALSLWLVVFSAFGVVGPVGALPSNAADIGPIGGAQLAATGVIVNLSPGVPAPPVMPGASFVIADMDTGKILAAKAPHAAHLPASTLKALTALVLIPRLDGKKKVVVKPEDVLIDGTRVGILPGTAYSVRLLMQGMLMSSGNDAAYTLARANKGVAVTLTEMNSKAGELGALDTVAKDPSGLDRPGQTSSSYDLALIGRAAMRLPDFRAYVATRQVSFPGGRASDGTVLPGFKINNHHRLLYNYPGAIGIKNGYTIAAQQTFIGAATRGGRTYIVTEMASPNGSWRTSAALLDWAFAHGEALTPIGELVEPGAVAGRGPGLASGAAQRLSANKAATQTRSGSNRLPVLPPWIGVVGLITMVGLFGTYTVRGITRKRR